MSIESIVNAGIPSVLPGYILSKPRMVEISECEAIVMSQYKSEAYREIIALPENLRKDIVASVTSDIKLSKFSFGMSLWVGWMMRHTMLPVAAWLCAKPKHAGVKLEDISTAMERCDTDELKDIVMRLWGIELNYQPRRWKSKSEYTTKPIDWDIIYKRYIEIGNRSEDFAFTTYSQLLAMFASAEPKPVSSDVLRDSAFNIFDSLCDSIPCTPEVLATASDDELVAEIRKILPEEKRNQPVDIKSIQTYLHEFIEACK